MLLSAFKMPASTLWSSLLLFGAAPVPSWAHLAPSDVYTLSLLFFKSFPLVTPIISVINAPHGRFSIPSALNLPGNAAWLAMEVWSPLVFVLALLSPQLSHAAVDSAASSTWSLGWSSLLRPSLGRLSELPLPNILLAAAFLTHYINRAIVQPLRSPPRSPIHLSVALSATLFNTANGFVMGSWLGGRSPALLIPAAALRPTFAAPVKTAKWFGSLLATKGAAGASTSAPLAAPGLLPASALTHPLFLLGLLGWGIGLAGNIYHDEILMNLRRPEKRGDGPARGTRLNQAKEQGDAAAEGAVKPHYEIPEGGLYKWISFPNYLCEWFEWFSLAVAALALSPLSPLAPNSVPLYPAYRGLLLLSAPPLLFPITEVFAMLPRAINGHRWYHGKFGVAGDGKGGRYPKERKAVLPGLL